MPRRKWIPKNPYCRRSRLDKEAFEDLAYYYFSEVFQEYSRSKITFGFSLTVNRNTGERHKTLTRQAIGRNFDRISQYIWESCIAHLHPSFQEEDVFEELLGLIYGKIDKITAYKDLYNYLDDFPLYINENNIKNSTMFYLLSSRSRRVRGFKASKFYLEFSRVFFVCAVIKEVDFDISSIYDVHAADYPFAKVRKIDHFRQISSNYGWTRDNPEFLDIDAEYRKREAARKELIQYAKCTLLNFLDENPIL